MANQFDLIIDRLGTNSVKWRKYPPDVLPLWVADMDFAAPGPIRAALQQVVEHGILGYESPTRELRETVAARMQTLYGWQVSPDAVVATPGVVAGFNMAARTLCSAGQGIIVQPPVYPPFLGVHKAAGLVRQDAPLALETNGSSLRYELDFDIFQKAVHSGGAKTGMFLLCNPHNPTGQIYPKDDLARLAEICLKNDIFICSDEIHSELLLDGAKHIPIAALAPEIADRTITLVAPSKTFNVPGLLCGFAIIPDKDLLERYKKTMEEMVMHVSGPGLVAAQVAFSGACDEWLVALRAYLTGNRDFVVEFVQEELDGIRTTLPEATYLAWLDCTQLMKSGKISGTPYEFFLDHAKVALNEGREFGSGGEGFVRLNFGCPRATLVEALGRMKTELGV
ncbi:MAG: MalY/PatB family protein [Anaerolineales bacterium]